MIESKKKIPTFYSLTKLPQVFIYSGNQGRCLCTQKRFCNITVGLVVA